MAWALCLALLLFATANRVDGAIPRVKSIEVFLKENAEDGSEAGGTRVDIIGENFETQTRISASGVEIPPVKAFFVNDKASYEIDINSEGNSQTLVTGFTRAMARDQWYYLKVVTNGYELFYSNCYNNAFHGNCRFATRDYRTPYLSDCYFNDTVTVDQYYRTYSGMSGQLVTCVGKIFTTKFGSGNDTVDTDENGADCEFRKMFANDEQVELTNGDDKYGMWLNDGGEWGGVTGLFPGTLVGYYNMSFILTKNYGRSQPATNMFKVSPKDRVYHLSTHADITSVSPQKGGTEGGTKIEICGQDFDATNGKVEIKVGGVSCELTESSTEGCISCLTGAKPDNRGFYTGARGVQVETWYSETNVNIDDVRAFNSSNVGYTGSRIIEQSGIKFDHFLGDIDDHTARIEGVVVIPSTGRYRFQVRGDDLCKLYVRCDGSPDLVNLTASTSRYQPGYSEASQFADWTDFQEGDECIFEGYVKDYGGLSGLWVALLKAETTLTNTQSPMVKNEKQRIDFQSPYDRETQELTFTNMAPENITGVREQQRVSIQCACAGGCASEPCSYTLSFMGVHTARLTPDTTTRTQLQKYLNEILYLSQASVTSSNEDLIVEFDNYGPQPLLNAHTKPGVTVTIERTVKGVSSFNEYSIIIGDRIIKDIPREDENQVQLKALLEESKATHCPSFILPNLNQNFVALMQDYEEAKAGTEWGYRKTDIEPFCGYTSNWLGNHIYYTGRTRNVNSEHAHSGFNLFESQWLCLAHRGYIQSKMQLFGNFENVNADGKQSTYNSKILYPFIITSDEHPWEEEKDNWRYHCIDLLKMVQVHYPGLNKATIKRIQLLRGEYEHLYYIDTVVISSQQFVTTRAQEEDLIAQRTRPVLAGGKPINKYYVTDATDNSYKIEVQPHACGDNMALVKMLEVSDVSLSATSRSQRDSGWPAGALFEILQHKAAVSEMSGTFDLKLPNGDGTGYTDLFDIPVQISAEDFKVKIQNSVPGFGGTRVTRHGDCARRDFDIEWTTNGGDKPLMEVNATNAVGHADLKVLVTTVQDGGVLYDPIPGDMTRLSFFNPQVEVLVEGIPSSCSGDCSFEYDESLTPTVTNITPLTGNVDNQQTVTITGTNLTPISDTVTMVTIGGSECSITTQTDTSITCDVTPANSGVHDIMISVGGKGFPTYSSSKTFEIIGSISSIEPSTTFTTGGVEVTITGTGFVSLSVFLAGTTELESCVVQNSTSATCVTVPGSEATVDVNGKTDGISMTTSALLVYTSTGVPVITSRTPTTASVSGTETLQLDGTDFGTDEGRVMIGTTLCPIASWTNTQVTCTIPTLEPGTYDISLTIDGGAASGSFNLKIVFELTDFNPKSGSFAGGTKITLTGQGFSGDAAKYAVMFGDSTCTDVQIQSSTGLTCNTNYLASRHIVKPTKQILVSGMAWDVKRLEVFAFDEVVWMWDLQLRPDSPFGILMFFSDGDNYYQSGTTRTTKQTFSHSFDTPGTYSITTEKLDGDAWGTIRLDMEVVVLPISSNHLPVLLKAYGKMADVNIAQTKRKRRNAAPCNGIEIIDGCTPSSTGSTGNFQADVCKTPTVTNISPTEGNSDTEITFTGTGFTPELCAISVTFGNDDASCVVTEATTTTFKCKPSLLNTTEMYKAYSFTVNVANLGNAAVKTNQTFGIVPVVTGITPVVGSLAGKTLVTITGSGFQDTHLVSIDSQPCDVQTQTFFEITCKTVAQTKGSYTLSVAQSNVEPITCAEANSCAFEYLLANTPEITEISPVTITSDNTQLDFKGDKFGSNTADVQARLWNADRETTCDNVSVTATGFTCDVATIIGGAYHVEVITNNGLAQITNNNIISSTATITSVTPNQGSAAGGIEIVIVGHGYGDDSTIATVTVGGSECEITSITDHEIKCLTPATTSSLPHTANVVVSLPGVTFSTSTFTYNQTLTPSFTDISPTTGTAGTSVTINGTSFNNGTEVFIGGVACVISGIVNENEITCIAATHVGGSYSVTGIVPGLGAVTSSLEFAYELGASVVGTNDVACSGGYGGGYKINLTGSGFDDSLEVRVCDNLCSLDEETSSTSTSFTCVLEREAQIVSSYHPSKIQYNKLFWSDSKLGILAIETDSKTLLNNRQLGHVFKEMLDEPDNVVDLLTARAITDNALKLPEDYEEVKSEVSDNVNGKISMWRAICPYGYHGLGDLLMFGQDAKPAFDEVWCVHRGLVIKSNLTSDTALWTTSSSAGTNKRMTLWGISKSPFFVAQSGLNSPTVEVYRLKNEEERTNFAEDKTCDVTLKMGKTDTIAIATQTCTYNAANTPTVTGFSPKLGGTAGGTAVTITGTQFAASGNKVTFGGIECIVASESTTQIQCTTEASSATFQAKPEVLVPSAGLAILVHEDTFYFVDRWSSPYTWGNTDPPTAGQFVVISTGQTVLLDQSTPVLKFLLIDGGKLMFDDESDIELQAEYILILNGGVLQIGTEENPHQHKATITLHGHVRSIEIPIYGVKSLGLRSGIIDMHGIPVGHTWTRLSETAEAGATQIKLEHAVDGWKVGDTIVLPTTGARHTQGESETAEIIAISSDDKTLTLKEPLKHAHVSESYDLQGVTVETRGEVGLLTRNIVFRGNDDDQWHDEIPACENGFDTGEFTTQTCFQGRFGKETGSDQFGAMMMVHPSQPSNRDAIIRLSNVELTHVGQAFRLGRYPIHFHLVGDARDSYVKECALHKTFNRAVTIHGTNYLTVDKNVVFDVMGGAIFIEDGIEMGNVIKYNLVAFAKQSTSLQNDDITPAAYWVTNPNNTIVHNVAAGGTHFGFWYRMHEHPDGPSRDTNICQRNHPVAEFRNNTVHSQGWFGIWIFQIYHPKEGGGCGINTPSPQQFHSLTTWNCEKGAEAVSVGAVQFVDFMMVNNEKAGIEYKIRHDDYLKKGQYAVINSTIVANLDDGSSRKKRAANDFSGTAVGLILPFSEGFEVRGTTFINFDNDNSAAIGVTKIDGKCVFKCGGWAYHFYQTNMLNSPNRVKFRWEHEGQIYDHDGTLSGSLASPAEPGVIVPSDGTVTDCPENAEFSAGPFAGRKCPVDKTFIRFSFNNVLPESLEGKNVSFSLINSTGDVTSKATDVEFLKKRLTHKFGWMVQLRTSRTYEMKFINADAITNISYSGIFYSLKPDDCLIMVHSLTQKPDSFRITASNSEPVDQKPSCDDSSYKHGDYFFDASNKMLYYVVKGEPVNSRRKRELQSAYDGAVNRKVDFKVYRCHYENCEPPPDPNNQPPARARPDEYSRWSEGGVWTQNDNGVYVATHISASARRKRQTGNLPPEGADVLIEAGSWIVMDITAGILPRLGKIEIKGVLEFEGANCHLQATHILILGGRLIVGWPDNPFQGRATIELLGDTNTEDVPIQAGPNLGAKAIGVIGGLDLHGIDPVYVWTTLSTTAEAGSNTITVTDNVEAGWKVDDMIVVATTSDDPWQNELFKITAINGKVLTLNGSLAHQHISQQYTYGTHTFEIRAQVGILTRNLKVIGELSTSEAEDFGCRVLIGAANGARGFGRISNTEFQRCGQYGHTESYDPRFAVAFLNTAPVDLIKPSYLNRNSFYDSYNTAIGVFGMSGEEDGDEGLEVKSNVIFRTIGPAIRIENSENTQLKKNLVMWMRVLSAVYSVEPDILNWHAAIEIHIAADTTVMDGNVVAGSERAGVRTDGKDCSENTECPPAEPTIIIGALQALFMQNDGQSLCSLLCNYHVHYAYDIGVHFQTRANVVVRNVIVTDSTNGIVPIVFTPSSDAHEMMLKYVTIQDSLVVGFTESNAEKCTDISTANRLYLDVKNSGLSRAMLKPAGSRKGRMGLFFGLFNSGYNAAPGKPFYNQMTTPAIQGKTEVKGVTFANFGEYCDDESSAVATNKNGEDMVHPMIMEGIVFDNVPEDFKLFYYYPSLGKINPSDCVDMECDGLKNALLKDLDGSFTETGRLSSIIPESEYEWDGDPQRGLGDYRIPKTAQTTANGTRIPFDGYKHGIYREGCTFVDAWPGYKCSGIDHEIMIIESMDEDHRTRRLSPVALITDGYVDLVNGPQDHGWCHGYTCQERLSTFWPIVTMNKEYEIYLTGSAPKYMRMFYLNSDSTQKMVVSLFMSSPLRKDVKVEGKYIEPSENKPTISSAVGSNYFDRFNGQMLTFVLSGDEMITIVQADVILISIELKPIAVNDFYAENVVNRLAAFLNIDPSKIKLVNVVRENSRRRKRAVDDGTTTVVLEIGDPPADDAPAGATTTVSSVTDSATAAPDPSAPLSRNDILLLKSAIELLHQTEQLGSILNATIETLGTLISPDAGTANPNNTEQVVDEIQSVLNVQIATALKIEHQPSEGHAGYSLGEFKVYGIEDSNTKVVLGDVYNPWYIQAKISSPVGDVAMLSGDIQSIDQNGNALFNDLKISAEGQYVISFAVLTPDTASHLVSPPSTVITISNYFSTNFPTTITSTVSNDATTNNGSSGTTASTNSNLSGNNGISNYVSTTTNTASTNSNLGGNNGITNAPPTTTDSPNTGGPVKTSNPPKKPDGLSPTMIGVIAGVSVAGILILILSGYLIFKCKQDVQKVTPEPSLKDVYSSSPPPYSEMSLKIETASSDDHNICTAPNPPEDAVGLPEKSTISPHAVPERSPICNDIEPVV